MFNNNEKIYTETVDQKVDAKKWKRETSITVFLSLMIVVVLVLGQLTGAFSAFGIEATQLTTEQTTIKEAQVSDEGLEIESTQTVVADNTVTPWTVFASNPPTWSLLNLTAAVCGVVVALVSAAYVAIKKRQNSTAPSRRVAFIGVMLAVLAALAGAIVFCLTEDMSLPMALVDDWTSLSIIIFAVESIGVVLAVLYAAETKVPDDSCTVVHLV